MYCIKCQTNNVDHASYCMNCGTVMNQVPRPATGSKLPDILLLGYLGIGVLCEGLRFVLQYLFEDWYSGPIKYVMFGLNIVMSLAIILVGFSIRNKDLKIIGIIISALFAMYLMVMNIDWVFGFNILH